MLKIDVHTHILPETWPNLRDKYGYPGWLRIEHDISAQASTDSANPAPHTCSASGGCRARLMVDDRFFREIESNCWDPAVRIADCDACTVHVQVLSTVPVMFSYWAKPLDALDVSRLLNDHIAEVCAQRPDRFVGLGTIPMQSPDLAARELERCISELGLAGVQIGSHVEANTYTDRRHDWNVNEPALFPIFQAAAELGAAVFIHPWDMMGKSVMPEYWLPWLVGMPAETSRAICSMIFGGIFERLPDLRVCFAHGGGSFAGTIGRIEHGFNVRPDLCAVDNNINPRMYLAQRNDSGALDRPARFFVDSLVHDADCLRALIRLMGEQRICLGSDYPFPLGEHHPGALVESMSDLTQKQKQLILGGTALEFLGVAGERIRTPAVQTNKK